MTAPRDVNREPARGMLPGGWPSMLPEQFEMQPLQQQQGGTGTLNGYGLLRVNQSTRGWLQELLGCEATSEFSIFGGSGGQNPVMHATEEAPCWTRCLLPQLHAFTLTVRDVAAAAGPSPVVAKYVRPCRCQLAPWKCCCFQEMQHIDGNGNPIGATVEQCSVCVPTLNITDERGQLEYVISQPTCCCGTMVDVFAEGGLLRMKVPFYLFRSGSPHVANQEVGKLVREYTNPVTESLTDVSNYTVKFPDHCSAPTKARILGSVFLVNQAGVKPALHPGGHH